MRIREVELVGFKSFVDKTRFVFDDRITAVVGPNGCGKSNIVDSIRWVMGELSAKSLRGDCMEDVIFNGTQDRKKLSMAQASLIFSTEDGIVPPGYEGFEQIEITRRLYRSGESEYLINKQAARLKDIQEMLMDTGLGAKAYSIVEQGQIARVISAKPEERRSLIEEAAGITKFKAKKEEALRKIERTLSDLDRVQDVVGEIKRQMNSLARQAGKAKRYKELKDEILHVDLELATRDYSLIMRQEKELSSELTKLRDTKSKGQSNIQTMEADLSAAKLELARLQAEVETARRELSAVNELIRDGENERNLLLRDIENEAAKAKAFEEEVIRAHERIAQYEQAADTDQVTSATIEKQTQDKQQSLDELNKNLERLRKQLAVKNADVEDIRKRHIQLVTEVTGLQSAVRAWNAQEEELAEREDTLRAKQAETQERWAGQKDLFSALEKRHGELQGAQAENKTILSEKKARLGTLKEELHLQQERFETVKENFQKASVRLSSLSEMKKNMEGYREGVRKILIAAARQNESGGSVQGVMGVIADLVKVPEKYEAAFEAVLGERLQAVVVKNTSMGMQAADFLKNEKSGRGSFVPLSPRRKTYTEYPKETLGASGGPLANYIEYDEDFGDVVRHLLDGVLVVDDLPKAVALHNANGYRGAFVTLEGEIIDPHGVITGGSRQALSSGILQMKREIKTVSAAVEQLQGQYEKARDAFLQTQGVIANLEHAIRQLSRKIDETTLEIKEVESALARSKSDQALLGESVEELGGSIATLGERTVRGRELFEQNTEKLATFKEDLEIVQGALADSELGTKDIRAAIEQLSAQASELSAEISADRERTSAALQRAQSARQAIAENRERVERLGGQIAQCKIIKSECESKIEQTVKRIEEKIAEAEKKAVKEAGAREQLEIFVDSLRKKEDSLKLIRNDLDGIGQEISRHEMKAVEQKMMRENLSSKIRDKYELELEEKLGEYGESEIDREALTTRQKEISEKIRDMGEVNLTAIEEHDEAKKRYEFYIEQQDDLLKSIDNLKQAISRINKESRDRFTATFTAVAAKFADVIPMLFGGGSAKLTLTESNDILDSGVEVHVRPPGKKLQNMNLLSGGEKALSALGMIFSIFLIKPSPFCLLDEVDAPLDEANVLRFNDLVEQMSDHSQIILITHNKRTMEKADSLYGVTMQEKGVSKLVTVQLSKN